MEDLRVERINKAAEFVASKLDGRTPVVGIVLGSGLGRLAEQISDPIVIPYKTIPGFPESTAVGHKGNFIAGELGGKFVIAMQGRFHYYEGYPMELVTLPIRVMKVLGISFLFVSNAAGGVNFDYKVGDLMIIRDHINLLPNPLIGKNIDELGTRFPDMSEVYSKRLREVIRKCAKDCHIDIQEGVYVQFTGPSYETPAEIRLVQAWGGDAVGMSTACEAMAAHHMGMEVCGISCITNLAAGISNVQLDHKEVQETADRVSASFKELVTTVILAM